jgi:hypothetical protein
VRFFGLAGPGFFEPQRRRQRRGLDLALQATDRRWNDEKAGRGAPSESGQ